MGECALGFLWGPPYSVSLPLGARMQNESVGLGVESACHAESRQTRGKGRLTEQWWVLALS